MIPLEIETLLSLPESARAKLAGVPGPGFIAWDSGGKPRFREETRNDRRDFAMHTAWCPADTWAIVDLCGPRALLRKSSAEPGYEAVESGRVFFGETPRLAALRLLALVSR